MVGDPSLTRLGKSCPSSGPTARKLTAWSRALANVTCASGQCATRELLSEENSLNICAHGQSPISSKDVPTSCHCLRDIWECSRSWPSVRRHGMAELRKRSGWNAILPTLADQPRECVNPKGGVDFSHGRHLGWQIPARRIRIRCTGVSADSGGPRFRLR
jgi:hypothetical protein